MRGAVSSGERAMPHQRCPVTEMTTPPRIPPLEPPISMKVPGQVGGRGVVGAVNVMSFEAGTQGIPPSLRGWEGSTCP